MASLVWRLDDVAHRAGIERFSFDQKTKLAFELDPRPHHILMEVGEVGVRWRRDAFARMMCAAVYPSQTKLLLPALASTH